MGLFLGYVYFPGLLLAFTAFGVWKTAERIPTRRRKRQ